MVEVIKDIKSETNKERRELDEDSSNFCMETKLLHV